MSSTVPEGWAYQPLSSVVEEFSKKTVSENEFEVLTSSKIGLMKQSEYYGENRLTRRSNVGFNVIPPNFITYRSRSDNNKFTFNQNTLGYTGIISKYYPVFTSKAGEEYNKFLLDLINYHADRLSLESVGTSQLVLSFNAVKSVKLPIPPLPEQQKIAAILSSVDDVIEKTQAQIDKLKDLKTGMMQELLTKGIGHTEFKDSPVGSIPVGWDVVKIRDITKVVDSLHQTPKFAPEGLPMIRVSDIKTGKVNVENALKVSPEVFDQFTKNHKPKTGDLLMSRVGSYGVCCYIDRDVDLCLGQNTVVIIPEGVNSQFLYCCINSSIVQDQIELEVAGSGYKSLSLASIRNINVVLPDVNEQKKIADLLASIDEKTWRIEHRLIALKNTKKALMQDLLTGKVRVAT